MLTAAQPDRITRWYGHQLRRCPDVSFGDWLVMASTLYPPRTMRRQSPRPWSWPLLPAEANLQFAYHVTSPTVIITLITLAEDKSKYILFGPAEFDLAIGPSGHQTKMNPMCFGLKKHGDARGRTQSRPTGRGVDTQDPFTHL